MEFLSKESRDNFIVKNIPLVTSRVLKRNGGIYDEDIFQEGCKALILAVDRFDEELGTTFSTYAVGYIDGYIQMYKNKNAMIKPLRRGTMFFYREIDSLDRPIAEDESISFGDMLKSDTDVESDVIGNIFIIEFMESLKDKEREVCRLRLDGANQTDIAAIVGVSQAQVCRILKRISQIAKRWLIAV